MWDSFSFAAPWAFAALLALPLLWWLLRLTPPRPKRVLFGAFPLLKNLQTTQQITARAPWWLWLLRLILAATIITAAAHLQYNAPTDQADADNTALILVTDNSAAAAANWPWLQSQTQRVLADAAQNNRAVLWLTTTGKNKYGLQLASTVAAQIATAQPSPWPANLTELTDQLANNAIAPDAEIIWLNSGAYPDFPSELTDALANYSKLTVLQAPAQLAWLSNWQNHAVTVERFNQNPQAGQLNWLDAQGHLLSSQSFDWPAAQTRLTIPANFPADKSHLIHAVQLAGQSHAGAMWLLDPPGLPPSGIVKPSATHYSTPLLNPIYYLNNALQTLGAKPQIDELAVLLNQHLPIIMLPDIVLDATQQNAVHTYIAQGGLLIRWLGPATLPALDDTLYPIPFLRQLRNSNSLTEHADILTAQAWPAHSALQAVPLPGDLTFAKVMDLLPANPNVTVLGSLQNQTPWLASQKIGKGQLIAIYTSATPEWSNLPITPLMPNLIAALLQQADIDQITTEPINRSDFVMQQMVNAFGQIVKPTSPALILNNDTNIITPATPPGKYQNNTATRFLNLGANWQGLMPFDHWPANTQFDYRTTPPASQDYSGYLWLAALCLLLIDSYVTLSMRGLLPRWPHGKSLAALGLLLILWAPQAHAADEMGLGYLGPPQQPLQQALTTLQQNLNTRTTATFSAPIAVEPNTADLALFPVLFWQPTTSALAPNAAPAMQNYLSKGGMLVIFAGDDAQNLATITKNLQLPALQTLPANHVLWHSFYLLQAGAWLTQPIWLDQIAVNHESQIASVIILPADLLDKMADPANTDRETAVRLFINVMIYALTGDYKSDQVHLPYILERLGQTPFAK